MAHTVTVLRKLLFFPIRSFGWDFRIWSLQVSLCIGQPQQPAIIPGFSKLKRILVTLPHLKLDEVCWIFPLSDVLGTTNCPRYDLANCNCHTSFHIAEYSIKKQNYKVCHVCYLTFPFLSAYSWNLFSCKKAMGFLGFGFIFLMEYISLIFS